MDQRGVPVVIAADTETIREKLRKILYNANIEPALIGNSSTVWQMTPQQFVNGLIVLETSGDVARLVQIVNDLHHSEHHPGGEVNAICLVPTQVFEQNQQLGFWLIKEHAAVNFVWMTEYLDEEPDILLGWIRRMERDAPQVVNDYAKLIRDTMEEYALILDKREGARIERIFDDKQGHYEIMMVGWDKGRRLHGCILHVDLIDGKIWVQHNGIEDGIADRFVESGVPKSHIVLGFHSPSKRPYTDFAVG